MPVGAAVTGTTMMPASLQLFQGLVGASGQPASIGQRLVHVGQDETDVLECRGCGLVQELHDVLGFYAWSSMLVPSVSAIGC
jgi:hypothetical protein